MAELEEREEIEFPPAVTNEAPVVAADQERLFSARWRQLEAQVNVLESQARQRKQEVAEMNSRRQQLEQSLSLSRDELAILAPPVQKGVMPRTALNRIARQVAHLAGEIRTHRPPHPPLQPAP